MRLRSWIAVLVAIALTGIWASTAAGGIPNEQLRVQVGSRAAKILQGVDSQKLPPFRLARDSTVTWSAPEGADSNFIFTTSQGLVVNALGPTKGKSFIEKGRHSDIDVIASGPWKITVKPAGRPRSKRAFTFKGVDGMNLPPFRLRDDSRVTWSAPQGADDNFIFSTDQDVIVNALGPTRGRSFMEAGLYTGVSVTGGGRWTIRIR